MFNFLGLGTAKLWGIGIAAIVLAGYIGWLKWDIHSLENDVSKLETQVIQKDLEITRLNGEVKECTSKIDANNEHISDLRKDNEFREKSFDVLVENIDLIRENTARQIEDIRNAPEPQTCAEVLTLLRKGVGQ